jgi:hypothetical protein
MMMDPFPSSTLVAFILSDWRSHFVDDSDFDGSIEKEHRPAQSLPCCCTVQENEVEVAIRSVAGQTDGRKKEMRQRCLPAAEKESSRNNTNRSIDLLAASSTIDVTRTKENLYFLVSAGSVLLPGIDSSS